jgi:hypothetical protein
MACKKQPPSPANNQANDAHGVPAPQSKTDSSADPDDHDHDHAHGSHGEVIALGSQTIAGWTVRAARDTGAIVAGKDAPIDVWLTGGSGKVAAVRFWIGTADAATSVKARASIEDPAQPNHWHTHAEIPDPMPADTKLWVEIEMEDGSVQSGSFDLKA